MSFKGQLGEECATQRQVPEAPQSLDGTQHEIAVVQLQRERVSLERERIALKRELLVLQAARWTFLTTVAGISALALKVILALPV